MFVKSKLTSEAQNVLQLHLNQRTSGHDWSCNFIGPVAVANGVTGTKLHWRSVPFFTIGTKISRIFKCPHRQKSGGLSSPERGGCTSKTVYGNVLLICTSCLILGLGTYYCILSKNFKYPLYVMFGIVSYSLYSD